MNIYLIGYRGTGKTTVGKLLSQRLGWPSIDTDEEIEQAAGKSIARIFAEEGEGAFRDWETKVIAQVAQKSQCVVSLGGGAVLREVNRDYISGSGRTVWLQASAEELYTRLNADCRTALQRPDLTAAGGLAEINLLLAERTPIYRQCADMTIDTQTQSPQDIAEQLAKRLNLP